MNPTEKIRPGPPPHHPEDCERLDVWGFADSEFMLHSNGSVEMTGSRYALAGCELPELFPWICKVIGVEIDPRDTNPSQYPPAIPEAHCNQRFREELQKFLDSDAITNDPMIRLRHGHGHTQDEMYSIKYGKFDRIPDLVVYPSEQQHVEALIQAALRHDVCLIPYGGGTNVSHALLCPNGEERMIVSIDMSRLNRMLWIDPVNHMACIEAGAIGRQIAEQLAEYGFTMGHEPDSLEFSTLGGWIATHASGMKKNRYGNIEDLVLDMVVETPNGTLIRTSTAPRESTGIDLRDWLYGSEGTLGVITRAVIKIFPIPEVTRYESVIFRSFEAGFEFLYDLCRAGNPPASVRLVDNLQFQLGMTLKPRPTGIRALKSKLERFFVTSVRKFDADQMVACTLLFEGTEGEVRTQRRELLKIAHKHGGMVAGSENGKRGYELTFAIAYIRDFVMSHHLIAESFETSVPWSQALVLCKNVKQRIREEYARRGLPGTPFISCRITQLYETGVCVYFYFAYYAKDVANPSSVYAQIERAAREEILRSGGSLSHHHGIGKLRREFLPDVMSPAALEWSRRIKQALDPSHVFGAGNQQLQSTARPPTPEK